MTDQTEQEISAAAGEAASEARQDNQKRRESGTVERRKSPVGTLAFALAVGALLVLTVLNLSGRSPFLPRVEKLSPVLIVLVVER